MRRQSGVVLPLFSVRTRRDWGIGQVTDLPACAAWIQKGGHRLLQVLPPHELSAGETSPYGALTAFGLDPIYMDVEALADVDGAAVAGALGVEGQRALERVRAAERVDYKEVRALKTRVLETAFERFHAHEWLPGTARARGLADFIRREHAWLDDLSLYQAVRESCGGWGWSTWPEGLRDRAPAAVEKARVDHARRILEVAYVQWMLLDQWDAAHRAMRDIGVELMGDLPFVVCEESADVWARPSQFQLRMSLGAPPDDFSAEGQEWGLPPYDWNAMRGDDLAWTRARIAHAARLYDRFRLDHVVGYFRQWVREKTPGSRGRFDPEGADAQQDRGRWVLGAMLGELSWATGSVDAPRVIAEDLGVVPPFARDALHGLGMPGYRVLPWERDGDHYRDPTAFPRESVASWSTHDTAPITAWWDEFPEADRAQLAARAGVPANADADERSFALLGDLFRANSDLVLILAQELLGVRARINTPATVGDDNWTWRLPRPIEDLAEDPRVVARLDAVRVLVEKGGR
jgi:4-alpha-glucanotransferase